MNYRMQWKMMSCQSYSKTLWLKVLTFFHIRCFHITARKNVVVWKKDNWLVLKSKHQPSKHFASTLRNNVLGMNQRMYPRLFHLQIWPFIILPRLISAFFKKGGPVMSGVKDTQTVYKSLDELKTQVSKHKVIDWVKM